MDFSWGFNSGGMTGAGSGLLDTSRLKRPLNCFLNPPFSPPFSYYIIASWNKKERKMFSKFQSRIYTNLNFAFYLWPEKSIKSFTPRPSIDNNFSHDRTETGTYLESYIHILFIIENNIHKCFNELLDSKIMKIEPFLCGKMEILILY